MWYRICKEQKGCIFFAVLPVRQTDQRSGFQKNAVFTSSEVIIYISSHVCKWQSTKQLPWKPYQVQACLKAQLAQIPKQQVLNAETF